jgi:sialate O-acetylesterase
MARQTNTMKIKALLILAGFMASQQLGAQIKLPRIFTDNMVVQRDKPLKVWGWTSKGGVVTVSFNGQESSAKADRTGYWEATLKPMTFGGPYEMTVKDKAGSKVLRNVLIGDVWFCSGQSNMEMPIQGWNKDSIMNAGKEIKAANYPQIRLFTIEKATSFTPADDVKGQWEVCSPATVGAFSATAYFFGRKLNTELNIPIGLINSTWGGTNIQAWTSWDEMSKDEKYKQIDMKAFAIKQKNWTQNLERYKAAVANDPGLKERWYAVDFNTSSWKEISMPKSYEQSEIGSADGIVWYKKEFELDAAQIKEPATLNLGAIDDWDETYINGLLVGKTNVYSERRSYKIEPGVLKAGKNVLVVKVNDTGGNGGFTGNAEDVNLDFDIVQLSLAGKWTYKPAVITTQFDVNDPGPNGFPSQLYNAMVAPVIKFPIKGAIWYQGEANAHEAYAYRSMFPAMIRDWRAKWHDEFPFIWVQLASFMQPVATPSESGWAALREAQHMTLALPKTGEAIAIDIGEANDIHPKNKQDVGYRLALAALKVAYDKNVTYSGPVYQSMEVKGNKIILSFANVENGLTAKNDRYGYLKGFAIAGADQKFVWAKATIEGDKVIVTSDAVVQPVAVRYAWGNNPDDANLYNVGGLPASPFRTDNWAPSAEHR